MYTNIYGKHIKYIAMVKNINRIVNCIGYSNILTTMIVLTLKVYVVNLISCYVINYSKLATNQTLSNREINFIMIYIYSDNKNKPSNIEECT